MCVRVFIFLVSVSSCDRYQRQDIAEVHKYLYIDNSCVLHTNMNCPKVSVRYGATKVRPINVRNISEEELGLICNKCFNESLYLGLQELLKAKRQNICSKTKVLMYLEPGYTFYVDLDLLPKIPSVEGVKILMVKNGTRYYVPLAESFQECKNGFVAAKFMPFAMGDIKLEIYYGKDVYNIPFSVISNRLSDFYVDFNSYYVTMFDREGKMVGVDVNQMYSYRQDGYKWYISGYERHQDVIYSVMRLSSETVCCSSMKTFINGIRTNAEYRQSVYDELVNDGYVSFPNFSAFEMFLKKVI